ncbi:MAG: CbiX/SirB N-terminal domain-containing protein [Planctomycetota bacterium]
MDPHESHSDPSDPEAVDHGVLLVGHGTRDPAGTKEFFAFARLAQSQVDPGTLISPCLLEFQAPTIADAWRDLVQRGVARITVSPLLLFSAGHAKSDIPDEIESARAKFPTQAEVRFARPISRQAQMIAAVRHQIAVGLQSLGRDPANADDLNDLRIVMVGRGSRDPCASADMRLLKEVSLFGSDSPTHFTSADDRSRSRVRTCFYAMAKPSLDQTLETLLHDRDVGGVLIYPHLLFSGRLHDAIVRKATAWSKQRPTVPLHVCPSLGVNERVAGALAERLRSTW